MTYFKYKGVTYMVKNLLVMSKSKIENIVWLHTSDGTRIVKTAKTTQNYVMRKINKAIADQHANC